MLYLNYLLQNQKHIWSVMFTMTLHACLLSCFQSIG